jgi:hypothetical protein
VPLWHILEVCKERVKTGRVKIRDPVKRLSKCQFAMIRIINSLNSELSNDISVLPNGAIWMKIGGSL